MEWLALEMSWLTPIFLDLMTGKLGCCRERFRVLESESEVAQSRPTVRNPMDCSPPGSSVRGIFQARILEWVAIAFSRRSSQPRD